MTDTIRKSIEKNSDLLEKLGYEVIRIFPVNDMVEVHDTEDESYNRVNWWDFLREQCGHVKRFRDRFISVEENEPRGHDRFPVEEVFGSREQQSRTKKAFIKREISKIRTSAQFTTKQLREYSSDQINYNTLRRELGEAVKRGELIRIRRGVYAIPARIQPE